MILPHTDRAFAEVTPGRYAHHRPDSPRPAADIHLTRWSPARADAYAHDDRHQHWLRTPDRLGLGFDS
ncbi:MULTISPECIES: hypothetical protein [unclassified Micromonospora]|uniref:hypothetical protein n=1 Tax=unclassified Micromonospora TaxID=2617518 RepID=UPI001C5E1681|nr:hypothetical protein [Micromonospora sp. RL09-050-HVF-A]MBW4704971.1 hypothetical protein [Micromonospora sp. RL09-050-HVF-A]